MWWKMRIKLNVKEINKTFTLAVGMCVVCFLRLIYSTVYSIKYNQWNEIFFCLFWKPVFLFVYTLLMVFVCELLIDASLIYHFSKWFCLFFPSSLWIIMFVFKFYYGFTSFNVTTIRKSWASSNKKKRKKKKTRKNHNKSSKMAEEKKANVDEMAL